MALAPGTRPGPYEILSAIAAQSADPIGDRQVTVAVKATILR